MADSAELWGSLTITRPMPEVALVPLAAWLEHHRSGLHALTLRSWGEPILDPAPLLASLVGSMLGALRLEIPLTRPWALDPLPQLHALTSLELSGICRVGWALPPQLSALTGLLSLDVHGNSPPLGCGWSEAGWDPLQHMVLLTHLNISCCSLSLLPEQLSGLGALVELCMGTNWLGDEGRFTVLQHLTALTLLDAR